MALRIGFDLDGVLADMEAALAREAEKLFGSRLKDREPQRSGGALASISDLVPDEVSDNAPLRQELHLTASERRQLWRHVCAIEKLLRKQSVAPRSRAWRSTSSRGWSEISGDRSFRK